MQIKQSNCCLIPRQTERLKERHVEKPLDVDIGGIKIKANKGVYATSKDTELMIETVDIKSNQTFLEIGCGTGIVSIIIAKKAKSGIGVDINDLAVENSKDNARLNKITNLQFFKSDVFENVTSKFDVIICNPPYTNHSVSDDIDRMYWDPNDEMKIKFFRNVRKYLKKNGKIYFGWANFADIDVDLPLKLAQENKLKLVKIYEQPHKGFVFLVLKFRCD